MQSPIEKATFDDSVPPPTLVDVESVIDRVVVHARGAVVTRQIELEQAPDGAFDVRVRGLSLMADGTSVKVIGAGAEHVLSVQTDRHVPSEVSEAGPTVEELKKIELQLSTLREQKSAIEERNNKWRALHVAPISQGLLARDGIKKRVENALQLSAFIDERITQLDGALVSLVDRIRQTEKEKRAAVLKDVQASDQARMGASHPSTEVMIRFEQAVDSFSLEYVVPYGAMWWPKYTLRMSDQGRTAELAIEAFVAQRTSEDWSNVEMAFATSDLLFDVQLPKLLSLRFGRAQTPPISGYRPPPRGVERLFEGFDTSFPNAVAAPPPEADSFGFAEEATSEHDKFAEEEGDWDDEYEMSDEPAPELSMAAVAKSRSSIVGAAANMMADGVARLESTRKKMQAPSAQSAMAPAPPMAKPVPGYGGGGPTGLAQSFSASETRASGGEEPAQYGLGDDWSNFNQLIMAAATDSSRGRLIQAPQQYVSYNFDLSDAQFFANGFGLIDPSVSRGMFDYRYESNARFDVPSDGRLHRVELSVASTESEVKYTTVPQRDEATYREAIIENPHSSPLLDGPIDVFSDGQFLSQTSTRFVASGGPMRIGLGEEERIKVARNARVSEESAGLLGGKREITHDVEIELRSGLPFAASVELFDRVPVTDDDDVDVKFVSSEPPASEYDQKDRDHKIRGGKKWKVKLEPGQKRTVIFSYTIRIKEKEELVGGNRREP